MNRYYVTINGISSLTIPGLAIKELPPITKTLMRNQREEIDGRDGDITTELGYSAYDKTMTIGLYGNYDINQVIAFFNQKGTIVFSDEADKYYNFTILERIDYAKLVKFRTASVKFHCQPFKYKLNETPLTITTELVESTGEEATLNNTAETSLQVGLKGNTYQETTTGKNLLNANEHLYGTSNNVKTTYSNGLYTINGQANASWWYIANNVSLSLPTGTYTFSITKTLSFRIYIVLKYTDNTTSTMAINSGSTSVTLTTSKVVASCELSCSQATSGTTYNETLGIQLESGSATSYEPYTNGASPNPDYPQEVKVVTGENVIKISNKNLIDTTAYNKAISGTTGAIQSPGTPSNYLSFDDYVDVKPNTTYTISFEDDDSSAGLYLGSKDINGDFIERVSLGSARTFTTGANAYQIFIYLYKSNGSFEAGGWVQLEYGSQATTYTPYQSQEYEINLGKNLLNIQDLVKGRLDNGVIGYDTNTTDLTLSDDSFTFTTNANYRGVSTNSYIPVKPNTTYYFQSETARTGLTIGMACYDNSKTFLSDATTTAVDSYTVSWTTPANARYCRIQIQLNASGIITITKPQLQQDKISDYSQYFTPIELCKIGTYQDYLYKSGDNWYKHTEIGKITLDGTEDITQNSNTSYSNTILRFTISVADKKLSASNTEVDNIKCNMFTSRALNFDARTQESITGHDSNHTIIIFIDSSRLSSADTTGFKAWLSSNTPVVYYVLETPVEEQITDEALITQLELLQNAMSYLDQTNVTQTYDDMPFILDLKAIKKGTNEITIDNTGNIYSKPIMALNGSGMIEININNTEVLRVDMTEHHNIVIDSANMEAYNPNTMALRNRQVNGSYDNLKLNQGANTIKVLGQLTEATISKYMRWL